MTGRNHFEFVGIKKFYRVEDFDIPYRTMTDWERGERQMPEYLLRLLAYKVEMERLVKKGVVENDDN